MSENKESTEDKRIKIKSDDLRFVPCNNKVLCKVEVLDGFDKSRGFFTGNAEWSNEGQMVTRYGSIVALPKKLSFREKPQDLGLEWKTSLEAKVGDIAYWGIMEGANCPLIQVGEETYYLIDYAEIRLLKREEEIIPVNGFVLLEEVKEGQKGSIIAPESFKKTDKKRGIVRYLGRRNECYYPDIHYDAHLEVGDTVLFGAGVLTELEDERYFSVARGLFYAQRRWIIATI